MPYVIDIESSAGGVTATLEHLVFTSRYSADQFCRLGNLRERRRSTISFTFREISPTEAEQHLAPSTPADR
jgi:hypothetical protein